MSNNFWMDLFGSICRISLLSFVHVQSLFMFCRIAPTTRGLPSGSAVQRQEAFLRRMALLDEKSKDGAGAATRREGGLEGAARRLGWMAVEDPHVVEDLEGER